LSRSRSEKDQLEAQLKEKQAEANRLQEELTKEQKIRANLKTVLIQATSMLQDIVHVSKQCGRYQEAARANRRGPLSGEADGQTPFLILDLNELGLIIAGTKEGEAGGFQIQDLTGAIE
jgi:hypothetical protein